MKSAVSKGESRMKKKDEASGYLTARLGFLSSARLASARF
jgi:hypothetical protein